ncbi:hypothetical protein CAPTEDRAFT_208296 [Capitella teleta]|uniref:CARD domain-containing protein n=1 Tax=Capitella teleta TaxID=283909 RepID=R7T3V1_CAPTE|nr:hypothetical protein CAPTEDRAFT_208296 [Capitella teleta]|eukprot:ELT87507.1 hypothetical protein CAPTEDRAFT_208296 [Capitella teleta]
MAHKFKYLCSFYSRDNKAPRQRNFIDKFERDIQRYEEKHKPSRKYLICTDWESSTKKRDKFFKDQCESSEKVIFLYDGEEEKDADFKYYEDKAVGLHRTMKTHFVPIALADIPDTYFSDRGLPEFHPIKFGVGNDAACWKRLREEILPEVVREQDMDGPRISPQASSIENLSEKKKMENILQKHWTQLKSSVDITEGILDHLFQDKIVSITRKEKLNAIATKRDKTGALLTHLFDSNAASIGRFFDLLEKDYYWLYKEVQKDIDALSAPGGNSSCKANKDERRGDDDTLVKKPTQQIVQQDMTLPMQQTSSQGNTLAQPNNLSTSPAMSLMRQVNSDCGEDSPDVNLQNPTTSMLPIQDSQDTGFPLDFSIKVKRGNVVAPMIEYFMDVKQTQRFVGKEIEGVFEGEEGQGSGVLREILSQFWEEFFLKFGVGREEKVPVISINLSNKKWQSVGNILRFGFGYQPTAEEPPWYFFPQQLCLASVIDAVHKDSISNKIKENNDVPEKKILLESFYAYVGLQTAEDIRNIATDLPSVDDTEWETINDTLQDLFEMPDFVNADNFHVKIAELAQVYLLQTSKTPLAYMKLSTWKNSFPDQFGSIASICKMYKEFQPTGNKVIKVLKVPEQDSKKKQQAVKDLRNCIRNFSTEHLRDFLCFVTGSPLMPKEINVEFLEDDRYPFKATTCSYLFYIPVGWPFNKFQGKLESIITDKKIGVGLFGSV